MFHPHIHTILLGGGLTSKNEWKDNGTEFFLPIWAISKVFRGKYMDELKNLWNTNQLEFHGTAEKYRNYYAFKELIDSCYDAEWIPYCKKTFIGAQSVIDISRHIREVPHFMDEPTARMDVLARDEMIDLLRGYVECGNRSILISSHISSDLENLCDDLYLIDDGQIIMHEETDTLLSNYGVLKVTEEQYQRLDNTYLICHKKEHYGYNCLTAHKRFYQENYPDIEIEKGTIDEVMTMMIRGEKK